MKIYRKPLMLTELIEKLEQFRDEGVQIIACYPSGNISITELSPERLESDTLLKILIIYKDSLGAEYELLSVDKEDTLFAEEPPYRLPTLLQEVIIETLLE